MPHYVAFHLGLHCLSKSELLVEGLFDFIESYVDMMEMVSGGGGLGTLIFSFIRRLGPFFGGLNFEFQYF